MFFMSMYMDNVPLILLIDDDCYGHIFASTSLQITTEGRPYLGAPLGSPEFVSAFIQDRVWGMMS